MADIENEKSNINVSPRDTHSHTHSHSDTHSDTPTRDHTKKSPRDTTTDTDTGTPRATSDTTTTTRANTTTHTTTHSLTTHNSANNSTSASKQGSKNNTPRDEQHSSKTSPRQENRDPKTSPRQENRDPKTSPRQENRGPKTSPRQENRGPKTSPRQENRGPKTSPRQENRGPKTSPRQENRGPKTSPRDPILSNESNQVPEKPISLMSSLRKANLILEREDSVDLADAVIERARKDNHVLNPNTIEPTTPLGRRLHDIDEDAKELKKKLASTTPLEKKFMTDDSNDMRKNATSVGLVSESEKLMPKPSDDVDIEDDLIALKGLVKESKKKKPISDKYLQMLQSTKSPKKPSSSTDTSRHRRSRHNLSTEPSRISQILNSGGDSRWADPRSSVQFKSQYEEMMFRSMQKVLVDKKGKKKKKNDAKSGGSRNTFERLSAAKKQDQSLFYIQNENGRKFASFDDAKNCSFMPKTNESKKKKASSGNDSDEEAKDARDQNFLLRQEANERKRLQEMAFQKGKNDYDALVDKKVCPVCTATQSYDEVKEKRKNCPNCQVAYTFKTNWGQVQHSFYKRQNDAYVNGIRALEEKKKEVLQSEKKSMRLRVDPTTGEVINVEEYGGECLKWTRDVEDDFFTRMDESKVKRDMKLKELEDEIYGKRSKGYSNHGGYNSSSAQQDFDTSQYY